LGKNENKKYGPKFFQCPIFCKTFPVCNDITTKNQNKNLPIGKFWIYQLGNLLKMDRIFEKIKNLPFVDSNLHITS